MHPHSIVPQVRFDGKYLSLTSFKRDGTAVSTPVWFVSDGGRLLVRTDAKSYKVKRIRRNPHVRIAPCNASGKLRGEPVDATAAILDPSEQTRVDRLLSRKYRIDRILVLPIYRLVQRLKGKQTSGIVATLAITAASPTTPPVSPIKTPPDRAAPLR